MSKATGLCAVMFVLSWACISSSAQTIYVDVEGPNDPGSGTFEDPFRRIQVAIDAAADGDTVEIRPGLYTGPGNYDLDPNGKSITICSSEPNNPYIVDRTIIDPNLAGRGFYIHSGEDANCVISGFTIRDSCAVDGHNGAGIYCFNSSPTIFNCVIRDGYAGGSGGGICFDYGSVSVINCTITGNTAGYYGGGISCRFSAPTIIGCTISGNTTGIEGGGIDSGMSDPNIFNCIIIDNDAQIGGGINCYYSGIARVVNCTIVANSTDYVGGAVHCWYEGGAIIENSLLLANSAIDGTQLGLQEAGTASIAYCDVQGGQTDVYDPCGLLVWGGGNIDSDPCFASFDLDRDPNFWDFHLQSTAGRWNSIFYRIDFNNDGIINLVDFARLAGVWLQGGNLLEDLDNSGVIDWMDLELFTQYFLGNSHKDGWVSDSSTSPCIDAGDPNSDWTSEPWPNGKRINMGAYGGTSQASKNGNIADFDVNAMVNFVDFAGLAGKWMTQGSFIEDLSGNGVIDYADVSVFAENWLWQKN